MSGVKSSLRELLNRRSRCQPVRAPSFDSRYNIA
jgi:hypothetical protein